MRSRDQDSFTATGPAVARSCPSWPWRSRVAAIAGSYALRRITAICPGLSHPEGDRSAERRAATRVFISCRSTAAAPRSPPPAVLICRAAFFMSNASDSVVACRSPAGPARSINSA